MKAAFLRSLFALALAGTLLMSGQASKAQTPADAQTPVPLGPTYYDTAIKFWSGQDVVPTFDGWVQNEDGTFTLVFGYFNRNYREELVIPPGPNNNISPGNADQGQPTIFVPRRQKWIFTINVPKDFGDKEVVWTLTAHGRTEKVTGKLIRQLYITHRLMDSHGNLSPGLDDPNKPPTIEVANTVQGKVSSGVSLVAEITDDGLPKPRVQKTTEGGQSQTNGVVRAIHLTGSWTPYSGPAGVKFDDAGPTIVADGKVTTTAHFQAPGKYVLIATADDSELTATKRLTVNVTE
jgi:hypothetical protein